MGALNMIPEDVTSDLEESIRVHKPKKKKKKRKEGRSQGASGETSEGKKKKKKKSSSKHKRSEGTDKQKKRRPSLDDGINLASAFAPSETEPSESESSLNLHSVKFHESTLEPSSSRDPDRRQVASRVTRDDAKDEAKPTHETKPRDTV